VLHIFHHSHACYMPQPSHSSFFRHKYVINRPVANSMMHSGYHARNMLTDINKKVVKTMKLITLPAGCACLHTRGTSGTRPDCFVLYYDYKLLYFREITGTALGDQIVL
jgi:hypothetical protein